MGQAESLQASYQWLDRSLQTIHRAHWHRQVKIISSAPGPVVELNGQSVLNFASNDYLGLAGDPRLQQAAIAAIERWGTGSTGSRLLSGHRSVHQDLETAIAHWKQTEAAVVFSSGYSANIGTVAALVGHKDLIVSDSYNHSSLKSGARLSGARVLEYAHGDMEGLQLILDYERPLYRRCLIITDSVFSMDGDLCPLPQILELATQFDCMVLLDEAHGTGVLGQTGAGCVEHFRCSGLPIVQMGTLSKALGSLGGYVAGSAALIDFLRNRAASWIYTTGLSPAAAAAALAAIQVIQTEPDRLQRLWQNVAYLNTQLQARVAASDAFQLLASESPIICLQVPDSEQVLRMGNALLSQGIWAPAIRPPTVPTSRIRISVMATHQPEHLEQLVTALTSLERSPQQISG